MTRRDLARRLAEGILLRMGLSTRPEAAPEAVLERVAYQARELVTLRERETGD